MPEIPEGQIGLIIGFVAVSSMVIKPLAGWGADGRGRKPILLAGATLFLVSPLLYPCNRTVGALLGVRLLHGAGMGFYPAAGAGSLSPRHLDPGNSSTAAMTRGRPPQRGQARPSRSNREQGSMLRQIEPARRHDRAGQPLKLWKLG